jgi:hypothetical protein
MKLILLKAGHAKAEIAGLSGVSLCSVQRIAEENPVLQIDDEAERRKAGSPAQYGSEFPETGNWNPARRAGSSDAGDFAASARSGQ